MRSVGAITPPLCSSERTRKALLILPQDMKSLNILRSECCFLFLEFILVLIAFASQNRSKKLQLCHSRSLRLMVWLFDQSSVFFVRLKVKCGRIIQRVRDISDLSVSTAIGEKTPWRALANCSPVLFLESVKNEGFHVTTSRYISRTVTAWWGWKLSQILSDGAATERSGAWNVAGSMSAVSERSNHCVVPALRLRFRWLD